mgnify:CR=1 FL=1
MVRFFHISETRKMLENVKRGSDLEVQRVHEVLNKIIDELMGRDDIMINLVDIRSFDEALFSHSVNVAILSVITGLELHFPQDQLRSLATGALLHDVGLLFCADEDHPKVGRDVLEKNGFEDSSVLVAVHHHHEWWNGAGYPGGLSGKDISRLARIIAVANTFDNMSANNKYPMEKVIEHIMAMSGTQFDPQSARAFVQCVSFYPVGTRVELNTGSSGFVVETNRGFPTRPIVRIDQNLYGPLTPAIDVNLVEHPAYFIVRRVGDEERQGEADDT